MPTPVIDLKARARRAMVDSGFHPDFPPEVVHEVQATKSVQISNPEPRDLRDLLWSSIDNDQSRDLDQIEYAEPLEGDAIRLMIGIADVDGSVPAGSATDRRAASESTSVYTGVEIFPMLPPELSTDKTSLLGGQERLAIVIEVQVLSSGEAQFESIYSAWTLNRAKLAYSSTGAWLEGTGPIPPAVAGVTGMEAQLRFQQQLSQRLRSFRNQHGALTFASAEANPVLENGEVKGLSYRKHNAAEDIIESFMVAANVAIATCLRQQQRPCIRRVVKTPRRWERIRAIAAEYHTTLPEQPDPRALSDFLAARQMADPAHFPDLSLSIVKLLGPGEYIVETPGQEKEGHFGLAVTDYTHSTAPNRRYADLITQRLLKSAAKGQGSPYSEAELGAIATHCTDREDAARKLERFMRKVIAASLLSGRIGEAFDGIVTGASPKGTYVRLLGFPAEGRLVHGTKGVDVGDQLRVRLCGVNVDKGFIDFDKDSG